MHPDILTVAVSGPINDSEFGNLIELPRIYEDGLNTVTGARAYTKKLLSPLETIDWTKVDALQMEQILGPLRENRQFIAEAKAEIHDARKPHTKKMDAIKALFTGLESDLDTLDAEIGIRLAAWESEKLRRQRAANEDSQRKIDKANEATRVKVHLKNIINQNFGAALIAEIQAMSGAYYSRSADELVEYGEALALWAPEFDLTQFSSGKDLASMPVSLSHHDEVERVSFFNEVKDSVLPSLQAEWVERVSSERDRLITLIPSRIKELSTVSPLVAQARIENERAKVRASLADSLHARSEIAAMEADNEKLNTILDNAPLSVSAPSAKGTRVKSKYEITAHTAFIPIIGNWVKKHLGKLTVDEAIKKLSFMITAANSDLNAKQDPVKLVAVGLDIAEDISVSRRGGAKKQVA